MKADLAQRPTATFVLTLWIALATALLCALLPAGLPLTKSIGSAFSPATNAVALRGRAEQVRAPAKRIVKDDPAPAQPLTLLNTHDTPILPSDPIVRPVWVIPVASGYLTFSTLIIAQDVWHSLYPRGPPTPIF